VRVDPFDEALEHHQDICLVSPTSFKHLDTMTYEACQIHRGGW
jgi:hypothetical protein